MKIFEVRTAKGLTYRSSSESEIEALEFASDFMEDGEEGIIEDATNRPVGAEGSDPEEGLL